MVQKIYYKTPRRSNEKAKSPVKIFTPLTNNTSYNTHLMRVINESNQNMSSSSIDKFNPMSNQAPQVNKIRSQTNHHYKRIKKLQKSGYSNHEYARQIKQKQFGMMVPDLNKQSDSNIQIENIDNLQLQQQNFSLNDPMTFHNNESVTINNNILNDFRSTKESNFFRDSQTKPTSSQSTSIFRSTAHANGKKTINQQIQKQTKQEILELQIIKKQLLDDISNLKQQHQQLQKQEEPQVLKEFTFDEGQIGAKDFQNFTKEELLQTLILSREEVVALRLQIQKSKQQNDDLNNRMDKLAISRNKQMHSSKSNRSPKTNMTNTTQKKLLTNKSLSGHTVLKNHSSSQSLTPKFSQNHNNSTIRDKSSTIIQVEQLKSQYEKSQEYYMKSSVGVNTDYYQQRHKLIQTDQIVTMTKQPEFQAQSLLLSKSATEEDLQGMKSSRSENEQLSQAKLMFYYKEIQRMEANHKSEMTIMRQMNEELTEDLLFIQKAKMKTI
ncbi:UNKNOWN [Stylonychia lemnae]|uniref:Uncharacterized protein n=1 Tax=Stylonychia lemnae TaxID=5949 RepID=A0A078A568_STYLE|nr:UNKNOWN [Stylonychia lemnae]|eukprot:CDW77024.1 UNKNOWN [Stylonychia lemnae]